MTIIVSLSSSFLSTRILIAVDEFIITKLSQIGNVF
nr:MAG TPA: hypothetical protein [Caudoviricetes sp.]